ncbi:MAG: NAD(P)H-dependent oxidoreductase [Candidatus Omnitrophota bacterium]|nr:NAD(P)H-dependent oxidoreductase [Candidatus Omnitrophota bacterium]MBU1894576.1 NAD(P)H-dependent oxidoreductase [Candidatus Omnitrophota bacterium]
MKKIAIIYYSKSGNTEAMARVVAQGAESVAGVLVEIKAVVDFSPEEALGYDGLIFGSPTYYGSMAHEMKKFFDDSVIYHGKFSGKVGGAFSSAANIGGGNETTIMGILNAIMIHGMIVEGTHIGDHFGPVSIGAPDERARLQCLALGKRVAELVKKLK